MSSTKRDWVCDQAVNAWLWSLPNVAKTKIDPDALNDVLNHVESIVRRELAGEAEKIVDSALENYRSEPHSIRETMVAAFSALLSPQNDAEESNV